MHALTAAWCTCSVSALEASIKKMQASKEENGDVGVEAQAITKRRTDQAALFAVEGAHAHGLFAGCSCVLRNTSFGDGAYACRSVCVGGGGMGEGRAARTALMRDISSSLRRSKACFQGARHMSRRVWRR
eukprot:2987667-Rhodomonas_salina.2